jgi:hypothetical protein
LAGVCITTLASFYNLGNNGWLQQKITGMVGYYGSITGGFVVALFVGIFFDKISNWIENG